jgi:uncharacterized protein (TIGR02246 family)
MGTEEQRIRDLHSTWINAVNAGDLARLLTLITDDAVFLAPGHAPLGRDGFSANFSSAQERVRVHCVSELEEVVIVGQVAFTRSRDALSVTSRDGGNATELAGYRMSVYREQPDGRWLLARDAHTVTPLEA